LGGIENLGLGFGVFGVFFVGIKLNLFFLDFYPGTMEENPDTEKIIDEDICDGDDYHDLSLCNCELCYYSREICEYIQDQTDRDAEDDLQDEEQS
jgi:hypothetical protein